MLKILFINLLLPTAFISTPVIAASGIFVATDNNPIKVEEKIILEEPERFAKEKIDKNLNELKEKLKEGLKSSLEKLFSLFKNSFASKSAPAPVATVSLAKAAPDLVVDHSSVVSPSVDKIDKPGDSSIPPKISDPPSSSTGGSSLDPAKTLLKEVPSVDKIDKPGDSSIPPKISDPPSSSTGGFSLDDSSKSSSVSNKINTMSSEALKTKLNALINLKTSMLSTEIKDKTKISNAKTAWKTIQDKINGINDLRQLQKILTAISTNKKSI